MRLSSRDEPMATAQVSECSPVLGETDCYDVQINCIANALRQRDGFRGPGVASVKRQTDFCMIVSSSDAEVQEQIAQEDSSCPVTNILNLLTQVHPKILQRVICNNKHVRESYDGVFAERGVLQFMRLVESLVQSEDELVELLSQLLQHVTNQKAMSLRSLKSLSMLLGLMVGTDSGQALFRWMEGLLYSPIAPVTLKQGVCSLMQMMLQKEPSTEWTAMKEGIPYGVNGRVIPADGNAVLLHQGHDSNAPQTVLSMFANAIPALVHTVKGYSSWGKKGKAQSNLSITAVEVVLMITLNLLDEEGTVFQSDPTQNMGEQGSADDFTCRGVWDEDMGWTFKDETEVKEGGLSEASEVFADGTCSNVSRGCSNDAGSYGLLCGRVIVWRDLDQLIDMVREMCQWNDFRGRNLYAKGLVQVLGQLEAIARSRDELLSMAGEEEVKPLVKTMTDTWKCYGPLLVPSQLCGSTLWYMRTSTRLLTQLEVLSGRFCDNNDLGEEMRSNSQASALTQLALVMGAAKPKHIAKLLQGSLMSRLQAVLVKQLSVADERVTDLASSVLHALVCDWELPAEKVEEGIDAVVTALAHMDVVCKGVMQLFYAYFNQHPNSRQLQALFDLLGDGGSTQRRNALAVIVFLRAGCLQKASDPAEGNDLSHAMSTIFQECLGDEELHKCWDNAGSISFPGDTGRGGGVFQVECADPVYGRGVEMAKMKQNDICDLLHASSNFGVGLLNRMLSDICSSLQPKAEDYARRQAVLHMVNSLVAELDVCEGGVVVPFGSYESNIFTPDGDLDLSLEMQRRNWQAGGFTKPEKVKMLKVIMRALMRSGNRVIDFIPRARVPLISFLERRSNVKCDLSVDNGGARFKSKVMRWILEIDHRCRELIFLVKCWARSHCINDPKMGTLNSYALSQLVIFHLQTCCPPILPPLSVILGDAGPHLFAGSWADRERALVGCQSRVQDLRNSAFGKDNHSTLAELFSSFFAQFSAVEDLWKCGLCTSTYLGTWGDRTSLGTSWSGKQYVMQVEDPFDRSENCARTVHASLFVRVRNAFRTTADALSSHFRAAQVAGSDTACLRASISDLQTILFSPRCPAEQTAKLACPASMAPFWRHPSRETPPATHLPEYRQASIVHSGKGTAPGAGVPVKSDGRVLLWKLVQKTNRKDRPECVQEMRWRNEGTFQVVGGAQSPHVDDFVQPKRSNRKRVVEVGNGPTECAHTKINQQKVSEPPATGVKGRAMRQPSALKSGVISSEGHHRVIDGLRNLAIDQKGREKKQVVNVRGASQSRQQQQQEAVHRTNSDFSSESSRRENGDIRGASAGSSDGVGEDDKGKKKYRKSDRRRLRKKQGSTDASVYTEECSAVREDSNCAQNDTGCISSIEKPRGLWCNNPAIETGNLDNERGVFGAVSSHSEDLEASDSGRECYGHQHPPMACGLASKASEGRVAGDSVPETIPERKEMWDRPRRRECYFHVSQGQEHHGQSNRLSVPPESRGRGTGATIPSRQEPPGMEAQQGGGVSIPSQGMRLPACQFLTCSTSSKHSSKTALCQPVEGRADCGSEVHTLEYERRAGQEQASTVRDGQVSHRGSARVCVGTRRRNVDGEINRSQGPGGNSGVASAKRRPRASTRAPA